VLYFPVLRALKKFWLSSPGCLRWSPLSSPPAAISFSFTDVDEVVETRRSLQQARYYAGISMQGSW